jgi:hypothetical protein
MPLRTGDGFQSRSREARAAKKARKPKIVITDVFLEFISVIRAPLSVVEVSQIEY